MGTKIERVRKTGGGAGMMRSAKEAVLVNPKAIYKQLFIVISKL